MSGARVGTLLVVRRVGTRHGMALWECSCDCGNSCLLTGNILRSGDRRSCGCLRHELQRAKVTRHGLTRTPTYRTWLSMRARCANKKCNGYENYGGRGIRVCERWMKFDNFLEDMGLRPSVDHSIERKDTNEHYRPGNCRWATRIEQGTNRTVNRRVTYNGETKTMAQWARDMGMRKNTLRRRLEAGWSVHDALTMPRDSLAPCASRKATSTLR